MQLVYLCMTVFNMQRMRESTVYLCHSMLAMFVPCMHIFVQSSRMTYCGIYCIISIHKHTQNVQVMLVLSVIVCMRTYELLCCSE